MPQGWGDSQPCTDSARIDVSDAQVGTKKQALRSNQETDEGKLRRPGELLDKENPIQGTRGQDRDSFGNPVLSRGSDVNLGHAVVLPCPAGDPRGDSHGEKRSASPPQPYVNQR